MQWTCTTLLYTENDEFRTLALATIGTLWTGCEKNWRQSSNLPTGWNEIISEVSNRQVLVDHYRRHQDNNALGSYYDPSFITGTISGWLISAAWKLLRLFLFSLISSMRERERERGRDGSQGDGTRQLGTRTTRRAWRESESSLLIELPRRADAGDIHAPRRLSLSHTPHAQCLPHNPELHFIHHLWIHQAALGHLIVISQLAPFLSFFLCSVSTYFYSPSLYFPLIYITQSWNI